jgi:hypothetical protein
VPKHAGENVILIAEPLVQRIGGLCRIRRIEDHELFRNLDGSMFSSTVSIRLNIEVLAPMPNASVSTATVVKPGLLRRVRIP